MGYVNLSQSARSTLEDIARMSYGFGLFGGRSGGKGRMGFEIRTADGIPRVIKFNTHYRDRSLHGARRSSAMVESSNRLRDLLWNLAKSAKLPEKTLKGIRHRLELDKSKPPKSLLDRTVVAKVVQSIGGDDVWNAIERKGDLEDFRTTNVATSFADMTSGQPSAAASRTVDELKSFDSYAQGDGAFKKIVDEELADLNIFSLKGLNYDEDPDRIRDLKALCGKLLKADGIFRRGGQDEFKFVSQDDIRRAVRQTVARLLVLLSGDTEEGKTRVDEYRQFLGEDGELVLGLDDSFFDEVRNLRDTMTNKFKDGDEFVARLLTSLFRNEMLATDPVRRGGANLSDLEIAPDALPANLTPTEQCALDDALAGMCESRAKSVRTVLGENVSLSQFKSLGLSLADLKTALKDFSDSFHLSGPEGVRYGHLAGAWIRKELERRDLPFEPGTPEFGEYVRQRLKEGAPLCNVSDKLDGNESSNELVHPAGGDGKNLCGSVRVGGKYIPLWSPVGQTDYGDLKELYKGTEEMSDEDVDDLREQMAETNLNEPRFYAKVIGNVIQDFSDGAGSSYDQKVRLMNCCLNAGRDFLRLFVDGDDVQNVVCHREFFQGENGKLQYRISAVVGDRILYARFQLEDDGRLTCQRLVNADRQGDAAEDLPQAEREELDKVRNWQVDFKSEADVIDEDVGEADFDQSYDHLPYEQEESPSPKELFALEQVEKDGGLGNPMVYYDRMRNNPSQPLVSGSWKAQRVFNDWIDAKKLQGDKWVKGDDEWQFFQFPGKSGGDEPGLNYKLYLTMPGENVTKLSRDDFERVYRTLDGLKTKCSFEAKFMTNLKAWEQMTDQVCCYFRSQEDLDAAVAALNKEQKENADEEHTFAIEAGQDLDLRMDQPAGGCNMGGGATSYNTMSYSGILSLRIWVARCIRKHKVPKGLESEFRAAMKFLKKVDSDSFTEKDRLLVAYVNRFLYFRRGLPVRLKKKPKEPALCKDEYPPQG